MEAKKKKKKLIIISSIGGLFLVVGVFFLGRISVENRSVEKKIISDNQEIKQLKTELNLVKNELNQSNISQKSQLENKLSNIENKIKILANQDKPTIQELQREIKEIKEKIKNDEPGDSPLPYIPPTDGNKLQFTVYYFAELGQNHMWNDCDTERGKVILIDKENSTFPNDELTKKAHNYTITFSPQDAEKFHNQNHVYYFSKGNNKFTLKPCQPDNQEPIPGDKKSEKVTYVGTSRGGTDRVGDYVVFSNFSLENSNENPIKAFHISKNHPRIKELLSEEKLQNDKQFTLRYGKVDNKSSKGVYNVFNENNQELEIVEET